MSPRLTRLDSFGLILAVVFAAACWWRPAATPIIAANALGIAFGPLIRGWREAKGLTLRPTIVWGFVAVALGLIGQIVATTESLASGRPFAGHWAYLSSLATIAALISTLGARTPGEGVWSILMGLLVLVFLIPWLEGFGLHSGTTALGRLRLDAPWSIFYGILVIAGMTNYLFTRHAVTSILVGGGLLVELVGLLATAWPPSRRAVLWSLAPLLTAWGILRADSESRSVPDAAPGLPSLWLWFRDNWGVVWALRVRERFHRAAETAGWPVRLSWAGVTDENGGTPGPVPPEAVRTLEVLLKRFATAERLAKAQGEIHPRPCPGNETAGE